MATSPNYGWLEPDNTDLVKNGALAIRTLGNAIDTTMATMTPKSTVTTKGDLVAATAASTPARLAVGNNGETLVADSSTSTGLRYQGSTPAGKNAVINGAFDVWQRGTSFAATVGATTYGADRWLCGSDAGTPWTFSRQSSGLTGVQYATRVQRTAGSTSTTIANLINAFESANSIPFAGQTVTLSFYARAGANYSATSSALNYRLVSGTGTDQSAITIGGSWTGSTNLINTTATLTTTWQRFTTTVAVGSTATQLGLWFYTAGVGTAGANDYYEITGVQLELGSVATAFARNGATIQGELAACQRYYFRRTSLAWPELLSNSAGAFSTTIAMAYIQPPVPLRTEPTSMDASNVSFLNYAEVGATLSSFVLSSRSTESVILCYGTASGFTQGQGGTFQSTASGGYLGFSAELQEMTMENVTFIISEVDGSEHAIIDRGNGEYTSMLKSTYEAMQAEQSTPILSDEAKTK